VWHNLGVLVGERSDVEVLSAPERIDRELTRAILAGTFPPGSHLPTVRDLARDHSVNPSTIQRALARLERRGLVTARQGSGLLVNDPAEVGDVTLLADWLAVTAHDPERAAGILADVLDLRRVLAARLLARHRLAVLDALAALVAGAAELVAVPAHEVWRADLEFARTVIRATGNTVAAALFNSMARALAELPEVRAAMYADPSSNAASMVAILGLLQEGGADLADRIEAAMAEVDERTVSRFRHVLAAEVAPS